MFENNKEALLIYFIKVLIFLFTLSICVYGTYLLIQTANDKYYKEPPKIEIKLDNNIKNQSLINFLNEKYTNVIRKDIKERYDETISILNFSIATFAISITIILALVGFISFGKIKQLLDESHDLLTEVKTVPEKVLQIYYAQQLNHLMQNLFNRSYYIRSDTIQKLANNSELNDSHYDALFASLNNELQQKRNPHSGMIISNLSNIIFKVNREKAYNDFIVFLNDNYDAQKVHPMINIIVTTDNPNQKKYIVNFLKTSNSNLTSTIISSLFNTGSINDEYIEEILINCSDEIVLSLLINLYNNSEYFNENLIVRSLLQRNKISLPILNLIIATFLNDKINFLNKLKVTIYCIEKLVKDNEKKTAIHWFIDNNKNIISNVEPFIENLSRI